LDREFVGERHGAIVFSQRRIGVWEDVVAKFREDGSCWELFRSSDLLFLWRGSRLHFNVTSNHPTNKYAEYRGQLKPIQPCGKENVADVFLATKIHLHRGGNQSTG
jgi:hypothetical protein